MTAEELCEYLARGRDTQRDKLATLHGERAAIDALGDADHRRVVREIKKRLSSPKLVAEVAELVAALARDYAPLPPAPTPPVPAAVRVDPAWSPLEAQIHGNPDDRGAYLVYGDSLASQGDPRGGLVTIGAALAKNPGHKQMLAAHDAHLAQHRDAILGPLAGCLDLVTEIEWFMGFVRRCKVGWRHRARGVMRGERTPAIAEVLGWLLDEPGPGRFLQHLRLGLVDEAPKTYAPVCEVIARRPRPSLRTLYLIDFSHEECELNWAKLGDLSALWPAVPALRELTLRAGGMQLGPIDLPKLEKLVTITGGLEAESLRQIAVAAWPALVELSLQIGRASEGAATDVALVEPILAGTRLPKLRRLGLANCEFTDEICERLPTAAIVPQLHSLDLSMGTMSDDGARLLVAHAAKLGHLAITVEDNYITDAMRGPLEAMGVFVGDQRDDEGDPDNRYASANE